MTTLRTESVFLAPFPVQQVVPSVSSFPPVRACLFDMDGLLINTEDIMTICHNILLARYSAGPMVWSIKAQLQGRPLHTAVDLLLSWANLKGVISPEEYTRELRILHEQEFPSAKALPGVEKLLGDLATAKSGNGGRKIHVALATSSDKHRYAIKTGHLKELFGGFVEERRILGDDARIPKGKGKPFPDIYLLALKAINQTLEEGEEVVKLNECLVFEDAIPGVVAGRRAGMRVVWVPHPGLALESQGKEAEILAGLGEGDVGEGLDTIEDGYGEQLVSLEDFPYDRYGIVTRSRDVIQ